MLNTPYKQGLASIPSMMSLMNTSMANNALGGTALSKIAQAGQLLNVAPQMNNIVGASGASVSPQIPIEYQSQSNIKVTRDNDIIGDLSGLPITTYSPPPAAPVAPVTQPQVAQQQPTSNFTAQPIAPSTATLTTPVAPPEMRLGARTEGQKAQAWEIEQQKIRAAQDAQDQAERAAQATAERNALAAMQRQNAADNAAAKARTAQATKAAKQFNSTPTSNTYYPAARVNLTGGYAWAGPGTSAIKDPYGQVFSVYSTTKGGGDIQYNKKIG